MRLNETTNASLRLSGQSVARDYLIRPTRARSHVYEVESEPFSHNTKLILTHS